MLDLDSSNFKTVNTNHNTVQAASGNGANVHLARL